MEAKIYLETERIILREWRESDLPALAKINADPDVMRYFPASLTVQESENLVNRFQQHIHHNGFGFFALELKSDRQLIGFTGLNKPYYALPFSPCVEIGWRLAKEFWGKGLASEAAGKCLQFAFEQLTLRDVVSFTAVDNVKSRSVMERIGMQNVAQNFQHPLLPTGHALREHVLYKIDKAHWLTITGGRR